MIITIICDVLGKENNGTTIACMNLIRSLKAKGHEVRVVCPDKERQGEPGWYVVPEVYIPIGTAIIHRNGVVVAKPDHQILESAIKDCDLMHTTMVTGLSKVAIEIAEQYHKPITSSFHCQAENISTHFGLRHAKGFNKALYHWCYRRIFSHSHAIHYPTQFIRDVFENEIGHPTNGYVISNGIHPIYKTEPMAKPEALKSKFIILSTGRFSSEKRQDLLIKAIGKSKYRDQIHLILAGCGPLLNKYERLAKRCHVEMETGFFKREELVDIINYADLYCHPAEAEIESIACLEAISCGLVPVISNSKNSATKAFALGEHNLFEDQNIPSLTAQIEYWIEHPQEKAQCRQKYLAETKRFSQSVCMDAMEKMIIETYQKYGAAHEQK